MGFLSSGEYLTEKVKSEQRTRRSERGSQVDISQNIQEKKTSTKTDRSKYAV